MMSSVYISHEVVEIPDLSVMSQQPDWRAQTISKLQRYGLRVVNSIDWALPISEEIENSQKKVRHFLELIDQCDAVLANLYHCAHGAAMEIFYAHRRGKVVTVVGQEPFSPWVVSHSQARFGDLEPAIEYIIGESGQPDVLHWALQYEGHLAERYEQYPPEGETDYQFYGGDLPVCVVAPHATAYFKEGEFMEQDAYTGSLVTSLHRLSGCYALHSSNCMVADPCLFTETPLTRTMAEIANSGQIGLFIVILGLPWQAYPVILEPSGPDPTIAYKLAERLRIALEINDDIPIRPPSDDVKVLQNFYSQTLSVPSIIVRVHRRFRLPKLQPEAFIHLVTSLSNFISEVGSELVRSVH